MIVYLFLIGILRAFNENLRAVHYSIVSPGIDEEIKPGKYLHINSEGLMPRKADSFDYGTLIVF